MHYTGYMQSVFSAGGTPWNNFEECKHVELVKYCCIKFGQRNVCQAPHHIINLLPIRMLERGQRTSRHRQKVQALISYIPKSIPLTTFDGFLLEVDQLAMAIWLPHGFIIHKVFRLGEEGRANQVPNEHLRCKNYQHTLLLILTWTQSW